MASWFDRWSAGQRGPTEAAVWLVASDGEGSTHHGQCEHCVMYVQRPIPAYAAQIQIDHLHT